MTLLDTEPRLPVDASPAPEPEAKGQAAGAYLLLSPLIIIMLAGVGAPCLILLTASFWQQESYDMTAGWGLGNYVKFFATPFYSLLLARSVAIAFTVAIAAIALAYPVAYFLAFRAGRHGSLLLVILTLPFWTSYLLRLFSWKVVLGYNGVINTALIGLGLTTEPVEALLYNSFAVVITLTHAWLPFVVLPIYVSLVKIPRELLLTAADLGDGPVSRFLRVVLPLSIPGVAAAAIFVFIPTVGDYVAPMLVGGTGSSMIGTMIVAQLGPANNWPLASAMSIITMAVVTLAGLALVAGLFQIRSRAR